MDLPLRACDTNDPFGLSRLAADSQSHLSRRLKPYGHVVAMNNAEFQLQALGDPRLAVHATSALPAWLWSTDGTRILWANPVGARVFGAANAAALAEKIFGPADPHRRQVAQLAGRLPANGAVRLERLHGFGAAPGRLATCGCSRLDFPDGSHGILIVAGNIAPHHAAARRRLRRCADAAQRDAVATAAVAPSRLRRRSRPTSAQAMRRSASVSR